MTEMNRPADTPRIADSHCHLDALDPKEFETAMSQAEASGIDLLVTVGMDVKTSTVAVEIAEGHSGIFAGVGLHPWLVQDHDGPPLDDLRILAESSPSVVAIGEIGLDFVDNSWLDLSYLDPELRRGQQEAFRKQLALARELNLPVILHSRGAHRAVTEILTQEGMDAVGGCVQFFEGDGEDVERYLELGFHFSVGASVTFSDPGGWYDTVRAIPDSALMIESDAPWLPFAGKDRDRSTPADLVSIVDAIAEIRAQEPAEIFRISRENCIRGFPGVARAHGQDEGAHGQDEGVDAA